MGQEGVTERGKGIGQRSLFSGHDPIHHKIGVRDGGAGKDLGIVELVLELFEKVGSLFHQLPVMGEDIEVAEKIGVHPGADNQTVGAANPDPQSLEYLAHLCQEILLRRIAD
jgi:hypothetical protein